MFFEGSEKRFELRLAPPVAGEGTRLRSFGRETWSEVVAAAGARILSAVSNEACDAYLLSESSLFVFDRRLVLITCGRSRMIAAVASVLDLVEREEVAGAAYERSEEHFPEAQPTSFGEDALVMMRLLPGARVERAKGLKRCLYRTLDAPPFRLAMEGIGQANPMAERERLSRLHRVFEGYALDEHFFEPTGYSLNGLHGEDYCTVHVTPQEVGSYASIETSRELGREAVDELVALFEPESVRLAAPAALTGRTEL